MSDEQTAAPAAPKKTRKKAKARRAPAARKEKPETAKVAYPGLTATTCAAACNADGCVISGRPYCAHPRKGGLQNDDMGNPEAIRRLQAAAKQLAMTDTDKRFS